MNLDVVFFGCDGLDGILEKIGADNLALTEGVMLLTPFAADSKAEPTATFVKNYKAQYGATPDQFAADGYDAVYSIAEAFKTVDAQPGTDEFNEAMIKAMTEITVVGTTGTMQWEASGEPAKIANAVVIKDGAYVAYK